MDESFAVFASCHFSAYNFYYTAVSMSSINPQFGGFLAPLGIIPIPDIRRSDFIRHLV